MTNKLNIRLDTFICVDLETTGLDHRLDKITEIGAVKYESGQFVDKYSTLINPGIPIPAEITELTHIDDKMVADAPSIEDVLPDLEEFLGEYPLIVGQNVTFDISFLKNHLSSKYIEYLDEYYLDTAALARMVWPGLKTFGLAFLSKMIGVENSQAHRALSDAEVTAEVYLRELSALSKMPENIKNAAVGLIIGQNARASALQALNESGVSLPEPIGYEYDYGDNILGSGELEQLEDYQEIDLDEITEVFDTQLRNNIAGFEDRPQQFEMARQVAASFNRSEILLAEAPTGIGKSMAYLIPAITWATQNNESVVISTQTKNLQDQLFNNDIPLIRDAIDKDFKAVLLKGRANYLCLYKYYEFLKEAINLYGIEDRNAIMALAVWAETTKTGDIYEVNGFNQSRHKYLWSRMSCEGNFCLGKACPFYKRCFLFRVKNNALTAHLCIVNHHLFFADFASGGDLVRTAEHAILDEAHNLEKVAASYLGPSLSYTHFNLLFNQIYTTRPIESGLLMSVKLSTFGLDDQDIKTIDSTRAQVQTHLTQARKTVAGFFDLLARSIEKKQGKRFTIKEHRYMSLKDVIDSEIIDGVNNDLKKLSILLEQLATNIEDIDLINEAGALGARLRAVAQDMTDTRNDFEFLAYSDDSDFVYWIDFMRRKDARLFSAPLEVSKLLDEKLYDSLKTLIFSSATLSIAGNFDFIKSRLGVDRSSAERTCSLTLDSPFDLKKNIGFYETGYMAAPNLPQYENEVADTILKLFKGVSVKGMVLFTSYRSIGSVVDKIGRKLMKAGYDLFVQDTGSSPFQLLSRYRKSEKAIIFGTDSFWEGVDLPGNELELLVITRLPFSVPDRPWIKANLEKIEQQGGSPFLDYSVPEAVIKFRQGFGRLIRKKSDRGCIVVLDSRLIKKNYGVYFTKSIESPLKIFRSPEDLVDAAKTQLEAKK